LSPIVTYRLSNRQRETLHSKEERSEAGSRDRAKNPEGFLCGSLWDEVSPSVCIEVVRYYQK